MTAYCPLFMHPLMTVVTLRHLNRHPLAVLHLVDHRFLLPPNDHRHRGVQARHLIPGHLTAVMMKISHSDHLILKARVI